MAETLMRFGEIYVFEETVKRGGIGEHISSLLLQKGFKGKFKICAVEDEFIPQMDTTEALEICKLDAKGIINEVNNG